MQETSPPQVREPSGEVRSALAAGLRVRLDDVLAHWVHAVEVRLGERADGPVVPTAAARALLTWVLDRVDVHAATGEVTWPADVPEAPMRDAAGVLRESALVEFVLLRAALWAVAEEAGLTAGAAEARAVSDAFDAFSLQVISGVRDVQHRTQHGFERLAELALVPDELDRSLARLLEVLVSATDAFDASAVYLPDQGALRRAAHVGDGALPPRVRVGEGLVGQVAESLRPRRVVGANGEPTQLRVRYAVPLLLGRELVGVAVVGSHGAYDFGDEEQRLFRAAVHRAEAFLSEARLQREVRARAEDEARTRGRLELMLASVPAALWQMDPSGRILLSEGQGLERLGLRPGELVGRSVLELYGDSPALRAPLERALTGESFHLVQQNGGQWWETYYAPVRRPDGALDSVIALSLDVSERELAAERHRVLEASLRESEARFRAVFDASPIGITVSDMDGRFLRVNPAARALLGYGELELMHLSIRDVTPPEDLAREVHLLEELRAGRCSHYTVERQYVARGGRRGLCRLTVTLGHEGGRPAYIIGLVEDLKERQRAEELERTAEFRERFIGMLGHDLRSPLNAISLSAQKLLRAGARAHEQRESVERIRQSADRMSRMIGDLLDFTRSRLGGGLPIHPERVDMREVVANVLEELRAAHPGRTLELRGEGDARGLFDPDRVAQVVTNLVNNALQYGRNDAPVRVSVEGRDGTVLLQVHNAGAPIGKEALGHLFDPFRRGARAAVKKEGQNLGLGLFIVRQIAVAHGGQVTVSSSAHEGTAFCVRWPRGTAAPT